MRVRRHRVRSLMPQRREKRSEIGSATRRTDKFSEADLLGLGGAYELNLDRAVEEWGP